MPEPEINYLRDNNLYICNQRKKWRTVGPCQNYKCEFYCPNNPDPENNCQFEYLQENCINYKGYDE